MGARRHPGETPLRSLPAVHELAAKLPGPHSLRVTAARQAIEERRAALQGADGEAAVESGPDLTARARALLEALGSSSLRRVLNATGVIIHTNLGRAPLAAAARGALDAAAEGYSNLELDLASGRRGSRQVHVEALLCELTDAEAALAVNNGAAAVLLAAAALAGPGRAIVVSRGQLVEIGGGFRIPEVVAQSGSTLIEVGTTNRTRRADYERALAAAPVPVGAIMRVHQSNFRTVGFVEEVEIEELCGLGAPVIDDVGSGALADPGGALSIRHTKQADPLVLPGSATVLAEEPSLKRSVAAGAALVCCSADKLLGGPQGGILVGRSDAVAAARSHPLARAVRIDKLSLAALEGTLRLYRDPELAWQEIPVLAMLRADQAELMKRAERLRAGIGAEAEIVPSHATVGGGALPLVELEGPALALGGERDPATLAAALRDGEPPLVGRVHDGRLLLDPRTLSDEDIEAAIAAVRSALAR